MVFFCCFSKPSARYEADTLNRPPRASTQQSQVFPKSCAQSINYDLDGIKQIASQDASASVIASVVAAADPETPISKTRVQLLASHEFSRTPSDKENSAAQPCTDVADDVAADVVSQTAPGSAHILQPQEPVQLHDLRQASTNTGSHTMAFQSRLSSPASVVSDVAASKEFAGAASAGGTQDANKPTPAPVSHDMHKTPRPAAAAAAASPSTVKNSPRSARISNRTPRSNGVLPTPLSAKATSRSSSPAVDQFRTNAQQPSGTSSKSPCAASVSRLTRPTSATIARAEAVAASKLATAAPSQSWKL